MFLRQILSLVPAKSARATATTKMPSVMFLSSETAHRRTYLHVTVVVFTVSLFVSLFIVSTLSPPSLCFPVYYPPSSSPQLSVSLFIVSTPSPPSLSVSLFIPPPPHFTPSLFTVSPPHPLRITPQSVSCL